MRNVPFAALAALLLWGTELWADFGATLIRTMPHQEECAAPLPADFWDDPAAKSFRSSETWAWNERICLGRLADMREAPGGSGHREECQPSEIEKKGDAVPDYRQLRPEFLEMVLSHQPWASAAKNPQVLIGCALVRGDIDLDDYVITPSFGLFGSKVEGQVSFLGTEFKRSLGFRGSTISGLLKADRVEVGGGLFLHNGATFKSIRLIGARISDNVKLNGSTVFGNLDADNVEVGGDFYLSDGGTFGDIDLAGASISGDVDLNGSAFSGNFNAIRSEIGGALFTTKGSRFTDISLVDARIVGDVIFQGSIVAGVLTADTLRVGGSLFLRHSDLYEGIRLLGARVAGDVDLIGSTVKGKLNGDELKVGGRLLLRDGGLFGKTSLLGARIDGDTLLSDSSFTGKFDADGLAVGGKLNLEEGKFTDIDLIGAHINGDVNLSDSAVKGMLSGDGLEVRGSLFLRNGGTFRKISLPGAKIGGILQLAGSTFDGEINLTGAIIDVELHLSSGRFDGAPTWGNGASLILRNANADALQAQGDSWTLSGGDGLLPTDLTGFTYNHLGGLDTSGEASMGDESIDWLIGWIEAQIGYGERFDPQPYSQLAQVLETAGSTNKAKAIRYAKFEHKRVHDSSMTGFDSVMHTLDRVFLGYGVYPFWMLCWFSGLVVIGGCVAQKSEETSVHGLLGFWYSLENALPLLDTNEQFRNIHHGKSCLAYFFHAQKFIGFVMATVLVGALTLLIS